ncbi:MAG TPA: DUF1109 domain-containing protein [Xanthobacteraceae bacterium]|nr:DUF1109 domain-containing protein [Xanthobacteraceae bacterium]
MTRTPELIDILVECATPVRRLRPPLVRAGLWLAFAGLILALVAIGHGVRTDLAARLHEPTFAASIAAALATGILAAMAAFAISLPDRSRWWLLLPLPALAVWIATIGYGCFVDWVSIGPDGIRLGEELPCLALLVLTGVPLAIALAAMLRHAALLRGGAVAMMGGLAVAAITATALSLVHDHDASVMILVWNLGTAALITGAGCLFGRRIFRWP